jgi:hypothetical protein
MFIRDGGSGLEGREVMDIFVRFGEVECRERVAAEAPFTSAPRQAGNIPALAISGQKASAG